MDISLLVAIITALEGITVAVIAGLFARSNRKNDEYREKREKREAEERKKEVARDEARKELQTCMLDLIFATANGTDVLLQAAHGDHVNGNVNQARESIHNAKSECNHLLNKHAANI